MGKIGQQQVMLRTEEHTAITFVWKGDDYLDRVRAFVRAIQEGKWEEVGTGLTAGDMTVFFDDLRHFARIRDRFIGRISSGDFRIFVSQWETVEEG